MKCHRPRIVPDIVAAQFTERFFAREAGACLCVVQVVASKLPGGQLEILLGL